MKFSEMSSIEMENLVKGIKVGSGSKGGGRKEEVLDILKSGLFSVKEIGGMLGVSNRNVSSVICYLRDDGLEIRSLGDKLVLWGRIVGGIKDGNRIVLGEGKFERFDFEELCFEGEKKKVVKK